MDIFVKTVGGLLIAVILYIILSKRDKDYAVILTIMVCTMVITASLAFLKPLLSLLEKLKTLAQLDPGVLETLLKVCGIGILGEITALICSDAGNASFGKALQFMTSVLILWLSIPLFESLVDLLEKILGGI